MICAPTASLKVVCRRITTAITTTPKLKIEKYSSAIPDRDAPWSDGEVLRLLEAMERYRRRTGHDDCGICWVHGQRKNVSSNSCSWRLRTSIVDAEPNQGKSDRHQHVGLTSRVTYLSVKPITQSCLSSGSLLDLLSPVLQRLPLGRQLTQ